MQFNYDNHFFNCGDGVGGDGSDEAGGPERVVSAARGWPGGWVPPVPGPGPAAEVCGVPGPAQPSRGPGGGPASGRLLRRPPGPSPADPARWIRPKGPPPGTLHGL